MIRRLPILPTLVVAAAVAAMIALGLWQLLIRAPQKEALIARYVAAEKLAPIVFPSAMASFAFDPSKSRAPTSSRR